MDHRSKTYKDLVSLTPPTSELLSEEIDGIVYSYRRESRCRVCNADEDTRKLIDTLLLYPKSYREVLRLVTPLLEAKQVAQKERPTYASIRVHQQRHLPFEKLAIREIVERRAKERGKDVLDGVQRLLTAEAFYETVVQKTWNRLVDGNIQPSLFEGMAAMKVLHSLEKEAAGAVDMNKVLVQLNVVLEVIRQEVSPEIWVLITQKLEQAEKNLETPFELETITGTTSFGDEQSYNWEDSAFQVDDD